MDKTSELICRAEELEREISGEESIEIDDFDGEKQCRCDFYIRKNTKAITWNGIYRLVNSVKAVPYRFTNS